MRSVCNGTGASFVWPVLIAVTHRTWRLTACVWYFFEAARPNVSPCSQWTKPKTNSISNRDGCSSKYFLFQSIKHESSICQFLFLLPVNLAMKRLHFQQSFNVICSFLLYVVYASTSNSYLSLFQSLSFSGFDGSSREEFWLVMRTLHVS